MAQSGKKANRWNKKHLDLDSHEEHIEDNSESYKRLDIDTFDGRSEEWDYYHQRFEIELVTRDITSDALKRNLLLTKLGPQPFRVLVDHLRPVRVSDTSYLHLTELLCKYYTKPKSHLAERVRFSRRLRLPEESVNEYILTLRTIAGYCDFGNTLNERIRDQIIVGINSDSWQIELLRVHNSSSASLSDVVSTALMLENVDLQRRQIMNPVPDDLHRVNTNSPKPRPYRIKRKFVLIKSIHCMRCGYKKHKEGQSCPAIGLECKSCGSLNHFSRACIRSGNAVIKNRLNVDQIDDSTSQSEGECSSQLGNICSIKKGTKVFLKVQINSMPVKMLYDPGAAYSVIGETLWKKIGRPKLVQTTNLTAYTGVPVITKGKAFVTVKAFDTTKILEIIVINKDDTPLFGLNWVFDFKLPLPPGAEIHAVKEKGETKLNNDCDALISQILRDFSEITNPGLGTIKNFKASVHLIGSPQPIVFKARPVPFALKPAVETEINRLVSEGVLDVVDPSDTPVTWASPIVVVIKPTGAVRICADFKCTLNKFIHADKHPMPSFEEISAQLAGGKEFSTIDLKDAYLQMEVSEESREFLVISTHKGYFRYKRLPFGIKTAPGMFQRFVDELLTGLDHVTGYLDDIAITAPTRDEHIKTIKEVLGRLSAAGVKIRLDKCKWLQKSVTYLGHKIDAEGIHPTQEHIDAIKKMPSPKNVHQLRSFLGTVNYYSKFVPNLQTLCNPLHKLLKKGSRWNWTTEDEQIVNKLKNFLTSNETLVHYNPTLPLFLVTDASEVGLGALLLHKFPNGTERPVAYASRTLSIPEQKYSVIDREALALIFGVTKFKQYLIGCRFSIKTDHKPLIRLFGEHDQIGKVTSNRLTRWALTLSGYDYEIQYLNGKENPADALSRLPDSSIKATPTERIGKSAQLLHLRLEEFPVTRAKLKHLTQEDTHLRKIIDFIHRGWPDPKDNKYQDLRPYISKREEVSFEDGILMWSGRIIVPSKLRKSILSILHEGHPGISCMKAKARFQVWWPGMDSQLEEFVKGCIGCQQNRQKEPEVPLFPWIPPNEPWSRVHIDYLGPFESKMWLLIVDSHTKWLEVIQVPNTSTKTPIEKLEELFSRYGLPKILVSDNGPQFTAGEFRRFCNSMNIRHVKTTPFHPKSNGQAERPVRTFKNKMGASANSGLSLRQRVNEFLTSYRASQHQTTGRTPDELMFGRRLRTKLDLLKPDVNQHIEEAVLKQQKYQQRHSRYRSFEPEEEVWVLNESGKGYQKGKIIERSAEYSYKVLIDGVLKRKHADHLRPAAGSFQEEGEEV